jgi:hypothetical protein
LHNNESVFTLVEDEHGTRVAFPITIDADSVRRFRVRAPIDVPPSVRHILDDMHNSKGQSFGDLRVSEIEQALSDHNLNLLGDSVEVLKVNENLVYRNLASDHKTAIVAWVLHTLRGKAVTVNLQWPEGGNLYTKERNR